MPNQGSTDKSFGLGIARWIGQRFRRGVNPDIHRQLLNELVVLRAIARRHSDLVKELFTDCYWGLLGNYRDLNRLARYVRTVDGFPSWHIEDIDVCQFKIGRIIELTFKQDFEHLRTLGFTSYAIYELEQARELGLKAWADRYADSDY